MYFHLLRAIGAQNFTSEAVWQASNRVRRLYAPWIIYVKYFVFQVGLSSKFASSNSHSPILTFLPEIAPAKVSSVPLMVAARITGDYTSQESLDTLCEDME